MCSIAATSSPSGSRAAPGLPCGVAHAAHERERRAAIVERHERQAHRRPRRQHPQRHLGDDAERAFGSDEQVDEVHARGGEVAGRELRHVRHAVARHTDPHGAVGQDDLEVPVAIGHRAAALDVEHVAAGQDDRQRLHPVARGAVLERRGARRVGGDDAAGEGAGEGRNGRIVAARSCKGGVEIDERDARPDAHRVDAAVPRMRFRRAVLSTTSPFGVAPPVSDDCAPIGSTAGADRISAATSASDEGTATPAANPPGKCAASSTNDASTSGSRSIRGATRASPCGARARIEWPGMRSCILGARRLMDSGSASREFGMSADSVGCRIVVRIRDAGLD